MKIVVDESSVGVGKTHAAIERAVLHQGLWLFAVERIDSIKEITNRIEAMAASKNVKVNTVPISSEPDEKQILRGQSVRTEVESLATKYQNGHVIAICSHSAMMMTDFKKFTDWHFICDEVPALLDITKKQTKLDLPFFEKYFELETLTTGKMAWSLFKPTKAGLKLNGSDLVQDESHEHLAKLHLITKLAHQQKIAKFPVTTLAELGYMEEDHLYWVWWSLLSISHFEPFKSVHFLASRFMDSMTRKVIESWNKDVNWVPVSLPNVRQFAPRSVSIKYYAEQMAHINFLKGETGQRHLAAIGSDIQQCAKGTQMIWSANKAFKEALENIFGKNSYKKPKQAGTDKLMMNTSAAMIYSAQPANYVLDVLKVFDLGRKDWVRSNEYETILQFVSRTSVRDANSSEEVQIFVYNKAQADYLVEFFEKQPHNVVSCEFVDLGLQYPVSKRGPKKKALTREEAEEKKKERTRKQTEAQRKRREKKRATESSP